MDTLNTTEYDRQAMGRVVRRLRIERGLSQEVFSGLAGLARSHLAMIESGKKQANLETLWKIASACEMRPSQLVLAIERECARTEKKN